MFVFRVGVLKIPMVDETRSFEHFNFLIKRLHEIKIFSCVNDDRNCGENFFADSELRILFADFVDVKSHR